MRALLLVVMCSVTLAAQQASAPLVTNQDLLAGLPSDGSKWLIHHGNYFGHRYSPLTQITPQNVNQLKAQWTFQTTLAPSFQTTPRFVDNVLYVTGTGGTAWARRRYGTTEVALPVHPRTTCTTGIPSGAVLADLTIGNQPRRHSRSL